MKCLIIAAGKGSRLRHMGDSKPLIPILGVPLIERVIRTALKAGADDFYVTIGYQGDKVRVFLDHLAHRLNIQITPILNEDWEKENGLSVLKAKGYLREPFLLLMADHIIDESILVRLKNERITDGEVILAVDYHGESRRLANIDDATKVVIKDNRIIEIGKNVKDSDAFDTGIFLCSLAIFSVLERSLENGDSSLSGGIKVLAQQGKARVFDIGDSCWVDVDDEKQLRRAEKLLYQKLIKPSDGLISRYINRRFSIGVFTPLLLKLHKGITPNQVSILSFILGALSSLFFVIGNAVTGAVLIQISSIVDGCDGEVARLKYMESRLGDFFDAVLDRYADGFILLGILYYLLTEIGSQRILGLYWSPPVICVIVIFAIIGHLMVSYTSAKAVVDFGYRYRGRWIAAGRGRDIRLFQLFVGGLMTYFHPIFALLAVLIIAVQTNAIVLRRIFLSWNWSRKGDFLIKGKIEAVIFDFDGTVADTMPFLTELAVKLMTENYNISRDEAQKRYLESTGMDFASQIELIFPDHPSNHDVVSRFESMKEKDILAHSVFPEVVSAFKYFISKKIKIFVCSSTRREIVEECVKFHKIEDFLEGFFGYRAGFGKGEQIAFIIQNYKLNPKEVLFVGDSLKDIDFVKDKETAFIGIARMFQKDDFERIGASSVGSLTDLVRLFEEHEKYSNYFEGVR